MIEVLNVKAGEKVVDAAKNIFAPQSISGASYVRFTSTQAVVGFFSTVLGIIPNSTVLRLCSAVRLADLMAAGE